ncbi:MAG: anthranilate synthase component I, partial [candidate division Zixibacteria bacterium]|nr:anthranilate synthase component I [candidate division Zixibacteria bacterium]
MISRTEARRLNARGNVIPIFTRIPADLDTPVGAFIKLAKNRPHSFLLESIEGGEKLARYSFLGFDPFMTISGCLGEIILRQGRSKRVIDSHPAEFLKELFLIYKPVRVEELPRFTGGGVGYFSYDAIRWLEDIPDDNPDDIELPEFHLGMYRHIVVFDHLKQEIVVIANILHDRSEQGFDKKYSEAAATINRIVAKLGGSR